MRSMAAVYDKRNDINVIRDVSAFNWTGIVDIHLEALVSAMEPFIIKGVFNGHTIISLVPSPWVW